MTTKNHSPHSPSSHVCSTCLTALNAWDSTEDWDPLNCAHIYIEDSVAEGCCFCSIVFNASEQQSEQLRKCGNIRYQESYLWYHKFPSTDPSGRLKFQIRLERAGGFWPVWCHFNLVPLDLYAQEEHSVVIGQKTGSLESWSLVSKWLESCQSHEMCQRASASSPKFLPSRLIYVGSEDDHQLRLCLQKDYIYGEEYATLSHCWGDKNPSKLLSQNVAALLENISYESLPKTFQDAVTISRRLALRYLWIDSLCIIQDSILDWQNESALMGKVYWISHCNISATAAKDGSGGLFFTRDPSSFRYPCISLEKDGQIARYKVHDDALWDNGVTNSELNKRSWVCQERLLSPRNLHFGSEQIFWECNELSACEQFPAGDHDGVFNSNAYAKQDFALVSDATKATPLISKLEIWNDIVTFYTQGSLAFQTDKLVALCGVASLISQSINSRYLAGLWETHFLKQLLWTVRGRGQSSDQYTGPSWSWASIAGPVWYVYAAGPEDDSDSQHVDVKEETTDLIEILSADVETVTADPYGQVKGGNIRVKGKLVAGRLDHNPAESRLMHLQTGNPETQTDVGVIWDHRRHSDAVDPLQRWILLPIVYILLPGATKDENALVRGIVLKSTEDNKGEYHRCGQFQSCLAEAECLSVLKSAQADFNTSREAQDIPSTEDGQGSRNYTIVII